jgi:histidinol phosphatase-like enzyme
MSRKVLFLDFDGVLNSERSAAVVHSITGENGYGLPYEELALTKANLKLDPIALRLLEYIVLTTKCDIVISSTWRMHLSLDKFTEIFKVYGLTIPGPIDKTSENEFRKRGSEIEKWLADHNEYTSYVIIDDSSDMLPYQENNFVQTDYEFGLRREDANKAIGILNDKKLEINHE